MDQGLILLYRQDPLSKAITSIVFETANPVEYTHLGFYYTTSVSGQTVTSIIYVDLFAMEVITTTFDELLTQPLLKKMSKQSLSIDPIFFRTTLAEELNIQFRGPTLTSIQYFLKSGVPEVIQHLMNTFKIVNFCQDLEEVKLQIWSDTEMELAWNTLLIQQRPLLHKLGGILLEMSLSSSFSLSSSLPSLSSSSSSSPFSLPFFNRRPNSAPDHINSTAQQHIKTLTDQVRGWLENIRNNETILVPINSIIVELNHLNPESSHLIQLRYPGSYAAIMYHGPAAKKLPVILRNGNRIDLALHNPMLHGLDPEVLRELLEVLDSLAVNTSEYDEVRSLIVKDLASK